MNRFIFVLAIAIPVLASPLAPVLAEDGVKIGYVDLRKVLTESKAGKQHKAEMEKLIKQKQDQLSKEEQKLRDLQQSLEKEKLVLTEAQRQEKQQQFQQRVQDFQRQRAEAQQELSQRDNQFTQRAVADIQDIIREIAKQEKLILVFEKNDMPVLYAADGPDLTEKVLQRYNARPGK